MNVGTFLIGAIFGLSVATAVVSLVWIVGVWWYEVRRQDPEG